MCHKLKWKKGDCRESIFCLLLIYDEIVLSTLYNSWVKVNNLLKNNLRNITMLRRQEIITSLKFWNHDNFQEYFIRIVFTIKRKDKICQTGFGQLWGNIFGNNMDVFLKFKIHKEKMQCLKLETFFTIDKHTIERLIWSRRNLFIVFIDMKDIWRETMCLDYSWTVLE